MSQAENRPPTPPPPPPRAETGPSGASFEQDAHEEALTPKKPKWHERKSVIAVGAAVSTLAAVITLNQFTGGEQDAEADVAIAPIDADEDETEALQEQLGEEELRELELREELREEYGVAPIASREPLELLEQYRANLDCLINAPDRELQLECSYLIHGGNPGGVKDHYDGIVEETYQHNQFAELRNRLVDVRVVDDLQDVQTPIVDDFVEFFVIEEFETGGQVNVQIAFRIDTVEYNGETTRAWIVTRTGPSDAE